MSPTSTPTQREDLALIAARLRLAITRTSRRLRQEAGAGLSPSQASALASIECHGPLTPSELAERERVRRPSATRIAAKLAGDGLIERTPDPSDARSALLAVTPRGRSLAAAMRKRKNAYMARRLRDVSAADLQTLERAAQVLERLLESESPTPVAQRRLP
jgi:DNA-binding MarR family transcriptional regulator